MTILSPGRAASQGSQPVRAAIYACISYDKNGQEIGVTNQIQDARAEAERRGWTVVDEYVDNDLSAYSGVARPRYAAMIRDAEAGHFDQIIGYMQSRLWRTRRERAEGMATLARLGIGVAMLRGNDLDLTSAAGRMYVGIIGEVDEFESAVKSERVLDAARHRADRGLPNGSIPFGWKRRYKVDASGKRVGLEGDFHHPQQAPIVKEVCERLLAGQTLREVTAWLNSTGTPAPGAAYQLKKRGRGVQNPDGQAWAKTSVKKLALRPANCGLRVYHRGRADETLTPTDNIEAIITRDQWDRLVALYGPKPDKTKPTTRPGSRVHLLTWGVGRCGVCGSVLRVAQLGSKGNKKPLYSCDAKGCVGRNEASVDTYVTAELILRLREPDVLDTLVDSEAADAAHSKAAALRVKLQATTDDYKADLIDRDQFLELTADLRPKIAQADRDAENASPTVPFELIRHVAGAQAGQKFADLAVSQKRTLVDAFIEEVRIMPTRRGPGFEPSDVKILWRRSR